jgi:hypothetical protein
VERDEEEEATRRGKRTDSIGMMGKLLRREVGENRWCGGR